MFKISLDKINSLFAKISESAKRRSSPREIRPIAPSAKRTAIQIRGEVRFFKKRVPKTGTRIT